MRKGKDRKATAEKLLGTYRGHLIIARALDLGVQELEKVKGPYREQSDIDDMRLLRDELFSMAYKARKVQEQAAKEKADAVREEG